MLYIQPQMMKSIENEFSSPDFDAKAEAEKRCVGDKNTINLTAKSLKEKHDYVNKNIVHILEKDSSLFVELSQCIAMFEREFSEFPQRITELKKRINDVKALPVPSFGNIPDQPTIEHSEILNQPSWYINAPRRYDVLIQQHRTKEGIQLVIKCAHFPGYNGQKVPSVTKWVDKTLRALNREIQGRLSKVKDLDSKDALNDFSQLQLLGFEEEGMELFLQLSSHLIDEKLSIKNNDGNLLQFVHASSDTLCKSLTQTITTFRKIFPQKYLPSLVEWVMNELSSKLPFSPDLFIGKFNFVKECIETMKRSSSILADYQISVLDIFETIDRKLEDLLKISSERHISEINESILKDQWDIPLENIRDIPINSYPLSTSFEQYRSHVILFTQEIRQLYVPSIFYCAANLLKNVIISYCTGCLNALKSTQESGIFKFCGIISMLLCVRDRVLPDISKAFQQSTNHVFPGAQDTGSKITEAVDTVVRLLVKTFIDMWSEEIPLEEMPWEGVQDINSDFQVAIDVMNQFLNMLTLPASIFEQATDVMVTHILKVANVMTSTIYTVVQLNSFDFHWLYFRKNFEKLLSKKANDVLKNGIKEIDNQIMQELDDDDHKRLSDGDLNQCLNSYVEKLNNQTD